MRIVNQLVRLDNIALTESKSIIFCQIIISLCIERLLHLKKHE